jgi:hypothetical protein
MVDFEKIAQLEQDLRARPRRSLTSRLKPLPADLEERRYELLASHLGFEVTKPVSPIHVVGDSHTIFFTGAHRMNPSKGRRIWSGFLRARYVGAFSELLPVFKVFHLGPVTAWQSFSYRSSTWGREKLEKLLKSGDIPKGAQILLVFGEIDIRCHIPKSVISGTSLEEAVRQTIERFMALPLFLKSKGYRPAVWHPSLTARHEPNEDATPDSPLPYVGSQELRNEICDCYCSQLREACIAHKIEITGLESSPAMNDQKYFLDDHHLSQNAMPPALSQLLSDGVLKIKAAKKA